MIKGVIFDMDGVLVDSEEHICKAAMLMFEKRGLHVKPEDFLPFVGRGEDKYLGGVAQKYNLKVDIEKVKAETYHIYETLVEGNLEPLPGVVDFIQKAKQKNLKIAVATSADRIKMEINLRNIGLGEEIFDATVNGLEVDHKKPDPEIFLLAAKKIGLHPNECLVVEDAINGVEAAKKAGAKCLGLTTSFNQEELKQADWIAKNLADASEEVLNW